MTVVPHPPYVSLFPKLKIKMKGLNFDTFVVIEAQSLSELNSPTGHGFQDTFKNGRSARNSAYAQRGTTSWLMVASRPKVSF
jgi:hypothetical protein